MPIYMDRHAVKGATSKTVADAHQKDLKLQDRFGVRVMTYWFDQERGSSFCLMDSPARENVRQLHAAAHGLIPNKIIEVHPDAVKAFLGSVGGSTKEEGEGPPGRAGDSAAIDSAFRAVMFTDMKDSTAMTSRLGDQEAIEYFRTHNAITRSALKARGGREIQHTGDGFMVSFASAVQAVKCAVHIQEAFAAYNARRPEAQIHVRIGISAGEPVEEDNRLFGSTVQLASRICDHCSPDRILVAPVIRHLCIGKGITFQDRGETPFKGFEEPQHLYEVLWQPDR
jgi:class 3 adenylate cyclase